jgi:peptide/nickel transport system substrate-binding protein
MVFLYSKDDLPAVSSRFHGINPGPAGIVYDLYEWYVPRKLQRYTAG